MRRLVKASTLRGPLDCIQPSLDQLDLLLTGGRIHNKAILRAAYDEAAGADRYKARNRAKKNMCRDHAPRRRYSIQWYSGVTQTFKTLSYAGYAR
jgi:hypothetical protein